MKKTLFMAALTVMGAMTMMTACGNNEPEQPQPEQPTAVASLMSYKLTVSEELLGYADILLEYYDENGEVQREVLKSGAWSKDIKAKLPSKQGIRLTGKKKDGASAKAAEYECRYEYYVVKSDDSKSMLGGNSIHGKVGFGTTEKLDVWFAEMADKLGSVLINFNAKGEATNGSWD